MMKIIKCIYIAVFPIITLLLSYLYSNAMTYALHVYEIPYMPSIAWGMVYSILFAVFIYILFVGKEKIPGIIVTIGIGFSIISMYTAFIPESIEKYIYSGYMVVNFVMSIILAVYVLYLITGNRKSNKDNV